MEMMRFGLDLIGVGIEWIRSAMARRRDALTSRGKEMSSLAAQGDGIAVMSSGNC